MAADQLKVNENKTVVTLLLALHWLPVKFQICYKIAVISFKTIHNMRPKYLSDLINIKRCSRYNLRSNVGVILHDPTVKFKCILGTDLLLQLLQRYGTVLRTILKKGMILISLRDSLRRTILKRPNATCLELS